MSVRYEPEKLMTVVATTAQKSFSLAEKLSAQLTDKGIAEGKDGLLLTSPYGEPLIRHGVNAAPPLLSRGSTPFVTS